MKKCDTCISGHQAQGDETIYCTYTGRRVLRFKRDECGLWIPRAPKDRKEKE